MKSNKVSLTEVPDGFYTIIQDFLNDLITTFPEYKYLISKFWTFDYNDMYPYVYDVEERKKLIENSKNDSIIYIYSHCKSFYPSRFFDILYQNADIFDEMSEINTEFLPRIVFKHLWNENITDNTKNTIWKYLQLILFTVVNNIEDKSFLGESSSLFEAIDETELKTKLEETLTDIQKIFENKEHSTPDNENNDETDNNDTDDNEKEEQDFKIPKFEDMNEHIKKLMGGKLGQLAMELAKDASIDFGIDEANITDTKDIFNQLFKNPSKLINMVKNVGEKINKKVQSGEISESEFMSEGLDLLAKMKESGMSMEDILKKFGNASMKGATGKGSKMDFNAMENKLKKELQKSQLKEKIKKKQAQQKMQEEGEHILLKEEFINKPKFSDEELIQTFNSTSKSQQSKKSNKNKK